MIYLKHYGFLLWKNGYCFLPHSIFFLNLNSIHCLFILPLHWFFVKVKTDVELEKWGQFFIGVRGTLVFDHELGAMYFPTGSGIKIEAGHFPRFFQIQDIFNPAHSPYLCDPETIVFQPEQEQSKLLLKPIMQSRSVFCLQLRDRTRMLRP